MAKPSLRELVESTGTTIDSWFYDQSNPQYEQNQQLLSAASNALYGDVGANLDTRNWGDIMSSGNALQTAQTALTDMYSDPVYREQNIPNLVAQGYDPAQGYYTYGQMIDRVGANYTPSEQEVAAVENYFQQIGKPDTKWLVSTNQRTSTGDTAGGINLSGLPGAAVTVNAGTGTNTGGGAGANTLNYSPTAFGGGAGERLGPGSANYRSDLIRSLRQADSGLMSQNTGFTKYGYTPPPTSGDAGVSLNAGGAFNPSVLNQDVASADDVANWNNYSTYRTNSLNAKTPITSFEEWLSGGKVSGIPEPVVQAPVYNYSDA
jgi:hypothetical protein